MATLVADCPRCGSKRITLDVLADVHIAKHYNWQNWYEAFCACRNCNSSSIFVLSDSNPSTSKVVAAKGLTSIEKSLNNFMDIERHISLRDSNPMSPPDHLPEDIQKCFKEAATCLATGCWNASGTMFRMCVDLATKPILPEGEVEGLNSRTRRDLGLRLPWLFENDLLPGGLRELSHCIREDGNDGAHAGTLGKDDAEDLCDFTVMLLERLFTEPKRLELAEQRREARRADR